MIKYLPACARPGQAASPALASPPLSVPALPLSHLVSQLVNKRLPLGTTATRRVRAQARSQAVPPCLLSLAALSCAARGIWHSPAPQSPILVAAQILLCGCKSSTIALIYNFCLAMQNTSAAVGGAGEAQAQEQCLAWHRWLWLWLWRWRRMCWLSIQIFCCLFALVRINDRQKGGRGSGR